MKSDPARRRAALWIFAAFSFFYVGITRGHFESTDEIAIFQQTRSLWERRDLDVVQMINAVPGRDGHYYAVFDVGQSIAALPLYGFGKLLHWTISSSPSWTETFGGPVIGDASIRWGGDVEIFVVNLFNAFVTALLCAVFFLFSMRLGATARTATIAMLLLGLTSYVMGFSTGLFQHSLETLALFSCFYLLFIDARSPNHEVRGDAGLVAGCMVLVRLQAAVALPALTGYVVWHIWRRARNEVRSDELLRHVVQQSAWFVGPAVVGLIATIFVNSHKFGHASLLGGHAAAKFDTPLLVSLFGFLFSPGKSIFIFTPLLVLLPLYWSDFARRYRAEAIFVLALVVSYLLFYGKYEYWHGWWCFGPRYMAALVPFLLLPLAVWWQSASRRSIRIAFALAAIGLFVQTLNVAVNYSYVFHAEKYESFNPPFGYLFVPQVSQLVTHWHALRAGDYRVDMWLINVCRRFGWLRCLALMLPLVAGVAVSAWRFRRAYREVAQQQETSAA